MTLVSTLRAVSERLIQWQQLEEEVVQRNSKLAATRQGDERRKHVWAAEAASNRSDAYRTLQRLVDDALSSYK